jgi:hypothetical protein
MGEGNSKRGKQHYKLSGFDGAHTVNHGLPPGGP